MFNIETAFWEIRQEYIEASRRKAFNALILGESGSGKTFSLRTARKPVLIHSFDPGGSRGLAKYVEAGDIFVDSRYENDSLTQPTAFKKWDRVFEDMRRGDTFESIGTFVIDSITTFAQAVMNDVLRTRNRNKRNDIPQIQDWQTQMTILRDVLNLCLGLPCDFIALGHLVFDKDETTGKIFSAPNLTGKLKSLVPALFDEVYITQTKKTSRGIEYSFLTQNDGFYQASSRLSQEFLIDKIEPQDYKALMKKACVPYSDKDTIKAKKQTTN